MTTSSSGFEAYFDADTVLVITVCIKKERFSLKVTDCDVTDGCWVRYVIGLRQLSCQSHVACRSILYHTILLILCNSILISVVLYVYMFYFVLIYFINFMYDITYIGLHVYSLYHNVMYILVYSL